MTTLSADLLDRLLPEQAATIFVAYSGGVDSHVLLHLCASKSVYRDKVVAVYVHHGLQAEADAWSLHCRHVAETLGVGFRELRVDARPKKRQSPEEAARIVRYRALAELVLQHDVLLVAQHNEDQLETVLLQLFRGSGVAGLAAMPECMPFGQGVLLRPLLGEDKRNIVHYAESHGLAWVEDPSNQTVDYDRNFLRNTIIPLLKQRWPAIAKTVSRSARHCAEAAGLLDHLADSLLADVCDKQDKSLVIDRLLSLDKSRRNLVLRHWFELNGLKPPGEKILRSVIGEVIGAKADAVPEIRYQGWMIKRFRGRLYCITGNLLLQDKYRSWPRDINIIRRSNGYRLRLIPADTGIPVRIWRDVEVTVRLRQGGEVLELPGRKGRHDLKKLFQELSVPPWLRPVVPLIYLNGQLAAVAGFCVAAQFYSAGGEPCYRIVWEPDE